MQPHSLHQKSCSHGYTLGSLSLSGSLVEEYRGHMHANHQRSGFSRNRLLMSVEVHLRSLEVVLIQVIDSNNTMRESNNPFVPTTATVITKVRPCLSKNCLICCRELRTPRSL